MISNASSFAWRIRLTGILCLLVLSGCSMDQGSSISTQVIQTAPIISSTLIDATSPVAETPQLEIQNSEKAPEISIPKESLIIVDAEHPLTEEFINAEIVPKLITIREKYPQIPVINETIQILEVCGDDLNDLITAAESEGVEITVRSGFRSYYQQQVAYNQATDKTAVNLPGESQHHTGLAIDFTSPEVGNVVGIYTGFGQSKAGLWLAKHAYEFGFVLSYTNNHDGVLNEEWHYFYLGKDLAKLWHDRRESGEDIDLFMLQEEFAQTP